MKDDSTPSVSPETIAQEWVTSYSSVAGFVASLVRDVHDREDILQETARYLVTHVSEYRGEGFTRWALQVARFRVLEYRQSHRKKHEQLSDTNMDLLVNAFVSLVPQRNAARESLEICIGQLSDRAQECLKLRYWGDQSVSSIASQMHTSANSVYVTLHRARAALALCIEKRMSEGDAS